MSLSKVVLLSKPACHPKLLLSYHKAVNHGALTTAPCSVLLLLENVGPWNYSPSLDWECALVTFS